MAQLLFILTAALVVCAIGFGVAVVVTGGDPGLEPAEPDARAVPLPTHRPLIERDLTSVRFDVALRGYRMAEVDQALARVAYDIGYKDELISVLESEIGALRAGRLEDAEVLRRAREASLTGISTEPDGRAPAGSEPAGSEPVGSASAGPEPVESASAGSEPVESGPDGRAPADETAADEICADEVPVDETAATREQDSAGGAEPAGGGESGRGGESVSEEPADGEDLVDAGEPAGGGEHGGGGAEPAGDRQPAAVDDVVPSRR